jgi:hypothetical protein
MKVGFKDLQDLTRRLYLMLEYPEAQTETILEVLSYAHRRGNFQSLIQEVAVGTPRIMRNANPSWRKKRRFRV